MLETIFTSYSTFSTSIPLVGWASSIMVIPDSSWYLKITSKISQTGLYYIPTLEHFTAGTEYQWDSSFNLKGGNNYLYMQRLNWWIYCSLYPESRENTLTNMNCKKQISPGSRWRWSPVIWVIVWFVALRCDIFFTVGWRTTRPVPRYCSCVWEITISLCCIIPGCYLCIICAGRIKHVNSLQETNIKHNKNIL